MDVVNERSCSSYLTLDSNKNLLYKLTYEKLVRDTTVEK